ncbi:hypothetical protein LXL04_027044 [Taraxacum kok-saghyz]
MSMADVGAGGEEVVVTFERIEILTRRLTLHISNFLNYHFLTKIKLSRVSTMLNFSSATYSFKDKLEPSYKGLIHEMFTMVLRGLSTTKLTRLEKFRSCQDGYIVKSSLKVEDGIVHWRNHLRFPEDAMLSPEAKDLIYRLLCDVEHRLGTSGPDQIKSHPWFKDVMWDQLYEMEAAFKPEVNGELDTQNFMKFDELNPPTSGRTSSGPSRKQLNPKDLNFVGYTYKNFDAVKAMRDNPDLMRSASSGLSNNSHLGNRGSSSESHHNNGNYFLPD